MFTGAPHLVPAFSIYQMSKSFGPFPVSVSGLLEVKYNRFPSAENAGPRSPYFLENRGNNRFDHKFFTLQYKMALN